MTLPGSRGFKISMLIIAVVVFAPIFYFKIGNFFDSRVLSDDEINDRFCRKGVQLAIALPEDEYCNNPELYRQHIENPEECLISKCEAF